jgi:PAS domain-containing protein
VPPATTDGADTPSDSCGVAIDVTELKEAEEALRASEERYRTLFASIDEGFFVIEKVESQGAPLDFRYIKANPVFAAQSAPPSLSWLILEKRPLRPVLAGMRRRVPGPFARRLALPMFQAPRQRTR